MSKNDNPIPPLGFKVELREVEFARALPEVTSGEDESKTLFADSDIVNFMDDGAGGERRLMRVVIAANGQAAKREVSPAA